MKIKESHLRQIIRNIIKEDSIMRDMLSPEDLPTDAVERAFRNGVASKEEIDRLNDIITTKPKSSLRDAKIAQFNADFGVGSLKRVCKIFDIEDIEDYNGHQKSMKY